MMSAVVGGIIYGAAMNHADQRLAEFRQISMEACLVLGPPDDKGIEQMPLLDVQLKLCKFGSTGKIDT